MLATQLTVGPSFAYRGYFPGDRKWSSPVLLRDGRILFVPEYESYILLFRPSDNSWEQLGDFDDDIPKWSTGILLPDSRVLFVPSNASSMLLFRPFDNSWEELGNFGNQPKWSTAVLMPNGKVLFVPDCSPYILLFTPGTNSWELFGHFNTPFKWCDGVLLPDGRVLFVPDNATAILLYNPSENAWDVFGNFDGQDKWINGVLLPQGEVLFVPRDATFILLFNPANNSWREFGHFFGQAKWACGMLLPDGRVLFVPHSSRTILLFQPLDNSWEQIGDFEGSHKWCGGILLPNGRVFFIPDCCQHFLIFNPRENSWELFNCFNGTNRWSGGLALPDGRVILSPHSSPHIAVAEYPLWKVQVQPRVSGDQALDAARWMWLSRDFADLVIVAGTPEGPRREILVHRAVLAIQSEVLANMLQRASAGPTAGPVRVELEEDPTAVEAVLEYAYTGVLPAVDPLQVLTLAHRLGMRDCMLRCLSRIGHSPPAKVARVLAPLLPDEMIHTGWKRLTRRLARDPAMFDSMLREFCCQPSDAAASDEAAEARRWQPETRVPPYREASPSSSSARAPPMALAVSVGMSVGEQAMRSPTSTGM
mmetsp:Transcript_76229/g.246852  ORF Transcript_76229/g.246852 Transcript_76229/m.246852 type:complete len:592 (+) Transcript_76229:38-1813(+)